MSKLRETKVEVPVDLVIVVRMLFMMELAKTEDGGIPVGIFIPKESGVDVNALYKQVQESMVPVTSLEDLETVWSQPSVMELAGDEIAAAVWHGETPNDSRAWHNR